MKVKKTATAYLIIRTQDDIARIIHNIEQHTIKVEALISMRFRRYFYFTLSFSSYDE